MEYNNSTIKKMYYGNSLVNMAVASGGELDMPANLSAVEFDDYGRMVSFTIKNGVTSIPNNYQSFNYSLTSCTVPSSVTDIGSSAFSYTGNYNGTSTSTMFDVSNIDLSNVSGGTSFSNIFSNSCLKGSITIPNKLLTGSTSGYTSACSGLFSNVHAPNYNGSTLNINVYADNVVIPRNIFYLSYSTNSSDGLRLTIYGTPTFLSSQSISCSTGGTVTFADCKTPPDAPAYDNSYNFPFYQFKGTLYVPSAGLSAWKTKYSLIASKIKAIPT